MSFEQPKLPYSYDALEPYIDAQTMEIHYSKHHAGYTAKFNTAIEGTDLEKKSIVEILSNLKLIPSDIRGAVTNNGGGFYNHSLFWEVMSPDGGGEPTGEIVAAINTTFDNFENFKTLFSQAATTQFGSGWTWLVVNNGVLEITSSANQDCPLSDSKTPILCLDVWEHAYYLKYQNKRPDYIENWWSVVNWKRVEELFKNAQ